MPTPATAPPRVMVFSCGTTVGITPWARHSRVSASYEIVPSASTKPFPILRTWSKWRTSSLRRAAPARSRNRFEVSFASPTGPAPSLSRAARASLFLVCSRLVIEETPGHRIVRGGDVALREHDLEKMRAARGGAEHLGAAVEVHAPDAAEALVEFHRVDGADALPVAVEALGPGVERERVMAAQVLDVDHLEAGALHLDDDVGEARNPAAGKHVPADEVIGLQMPHMADEVDQAEAAGLEAARMRADQVEERVAAGMLEAADRHHLVELAIDVAEISGDCKRIAKAHALDFAARMVDLRTSRVDTGDLDAVALLRIQHEAAEAAADVDHVLARREQHLPRDVVELVALRLLQAARAFLPVRAGVEHERVVEPKAVELGPERVVELGVVPGPGPARVRVQELVPAVEHPDQQLGVVDAALHAGGERAREAALDVELAVEVGFEQADMAESGDTPVGARLAEHQGEGGRGLRVAVLAAAGVAHRERNAGALPDPAEHGFSEGSHAPRL